MVGNEKHNKKPGIKNGLVKNILNTIDYLENITDLNLCDRNISSFSEDLKLPPNIVHLNISKNKLTEVPATVLNLDNLSTLDLSFNFIVFFDDSPSFCHTIKHLNLSNNSLEGLPLWVWAEKPKNLIELNLSNNRHICESLTHDYFEELTQRTTLVNKIDVHNCKLSKYVKLLATFCHAKVIKLGSKDYEYYSVNNLDHVPCEGLDQCCDVEKLDLCNTQIYHINSNIDMYNNLKELNLAQNNINSLPNEFCNLDNLQTCILSINKLLYLPDNMDKLTNLVILHLDNNELCMLPENLYEMPSLKTLDLYNNNLCECFDYINSLEKIDLAQNFFDELDDEEYLVKKEKLRVNCFDRVDGKKNEVVKEHSEYSEYSGDETDDEELYGLISNEEERCIQQGGQELTNSQSSTPEDWDSDDYWIPQYYKPITPQYYKPVTAPRSPWLCFVKKKMEEGNFCPMDAHPVSIVEQVKYEKMCKPQVEYESDGQFDDYSDDDS